MGNGENGWNLYTGGWCTPVYDEAQLKTTRARASLSLLFSSCFEMGAAVQWFTAAYKNLGTFVDGRNRWKVWVEWVLMDRCGDVWLAMQVWKNETWALIYIYYSHIAPHTHIYIIRYIYICICICICTCSIITTTISNVSIPKLFSMWFTCRWCRTWSEASRRCAVRYQFRPSWGWGKYWWTPKWMV